MDSKNKLSKENSLTYGKQTMAWLLDLPDWLSHKMFLAGGLVAIVLGFFIFASSIARHFLNSPIRGTYELSGYALFIITFLSIPYLLKMDKHVSIDAIKELFSPRVQKYLDLFSLAICFPLGLMLFYFSSRITLELYRSGLTLFDTIEPPRYLLMMFVPLCFLIFSLIALKKLIIAIKELRANQLDSKA